MLFYFIFVIIALIHCVVTMNYDNIDMFSFHLHILSYVIIVVCTLNPFPSLFAS